MGGKDRQVLEKIIKHIETILKYGHGFEGFEDFKDDRMCVDACVMNLLQIGELAKVGLSDDVKKQIKTVSWNRIYGIRGRILDEVSGVNVEAVWEMISEKLPLLLTELKTFLRESETK